MILKWIFVAIIVAVLAMLALAPLILSAQLDEEERARN
jgi:hypothetical protein